MAEYLLDIGNISNREMLSNSCKTERAEAGRKRTAAGVLSYLVSDNLDNKQKTVPRGEDAPDWS